MLNRLPAITSTAVLALSLSVPAFAQNTSWGDANNGYGLYHQSNGAATGQDTNENGYGLFITRVMVPRPVGAVPKLATASTTRAIVPRPRNLFRASTNPAPGFWSL
jgi:hypothetical protein